MLKSISSLCVVFFLFSCKKEAKLDFSNRTFSSEKKAIVSIIIPEAKGSSSTAKTINTTLEQFACQALNIDASKENLSLIEESAKQFDASYAAFKKHISNELSQELPIWEANIDGEITFKSDDIVSIAMNSSINTGAAKSNFKIKFFNFNPSNGQQLTLKDIINDLNGFTKLVKKYYDKELLTTYANEQSPIHKTAFKLPETIGFNDEGVIVFYNNYEFLTPASEVLEFTIPYVAANEFLTF